MKESDHIEANNPRTNISKAILVLLLSNKNKNGIDRFQDWCKTWTLTLGLLFEIVK
jgi:hypothetical protein